ncbi:hypothetical protein BGP_3242 [Beggiatoa sp. PS]|nr:hypothetical protein BGP_3242 [Beggiatoa sp. PS]
MTMDSENMIASAVKKKFAYECYQIVSNQSNLNTNFCEYKTCLSDSFCKIKKNLTSFENLSGLTTIQFNAFFGSTLDRMFSTIIGKTVSIVLQPLDS